MVLLLDLLPFLIAESESTHFLTEQAPDKGCISDIVLTSQYIGLDKHIF